jgi:hypothetical protein
MIELEKFLPSETDTWTWDRARIMDVPEIVHMAQQHFQMEIASVFTPDPHIYSKNVALACVEQSFDSSKCQLITARDNTTKKLLAYAWLNRGHHMVYAREECAEAAFAHMDMSLPLRTRITLMAQILQQWTLWCQIWQIPVLVSTTIREDQRGFINLHRAAGFSVRGSFAFKRIV